MTAPASQKSGAQRMPHGLVEYESRDGIATLTMTDPPANTYTHEMMLDLDLAVLKARFDDEAHVIVRMARPSRDSYSTSPLGMRWAADGLF